MILKVYEGFIIRDQRKKLALKSQFFVPKCKNIQRKVSAKRNFHYVFLNIIKLINLGAEFSVSYKGLKKFKE